MEPEVKLYKHALLHGHSSIRLMTLLPGVRGTPLKCHITEHQDHSDTPYDALSYTWGESLPSEGIAVCQSANTEHADGYISITPNLFEALLRLRSDDTPRTLWIDALCINQDDLQEKAQQVAHMGRVYSGASQVVVWLGEDEAFPRTRALLTQDGRNRWPLTLPEVDLGELVSIPW